MYMIFNCRDDEEQTNGDAGDEETESSAAPVKKTSAWGKQRKGGKGGKGGKKVVNQKKKAPAPNKPAAATAASGTSSTPSSPKPRADADSDADSESEDVSDASGSDEPKERNIADDDDDEEWEKFQAKLNKREKLEGKSRISHTVHCPYFPEEKQEYWWTYICDRKSRTLLTAPYHVTNLKEREEIQLKFTAPRWTGVYTFTVCLRSGKNINL